MTVEHNYFKHICRKYGYNITYKLHDTEGGYYWHPNVYNIGKFVHELRKSHEWCGVVVFHKDREVAQFNEIIPAENFVKTLLSLEGYM